MAFVTELVNHFRLVWRLFWDSRVRRGQRLIFAIPVLYLLVPDGYYLLADLLPLIGLLDDWLLFVACTYAFVAICPHSAARQIRTVVRLCDPDPDVRERALADRVVLAKLSLAEQFEMYRHPREPLALALGLVILAGVSAAGGLLTTALLIMLVALSYGVVNISCTRSVRNAAQVTAESHPQLQACIDRCFDRLPHVPVRVLVVPTGDCRIYSFGLDQPYTIVLGSGLVKEIDADELVAVIGHELGHILFDHVFLSSLMGGMLHPSSVIAYLWGTIFAPWRRLAELSADRAALLACGEVDVVVRTLIVRMPGEADREIDVQAVLRDIYAPQGEPPEYADRAGPGSPLVKRIRALIDFDAELLALDVEKWLTVR